MHELSVTEGILKICLEEGKKHNVEKIKKINIVVGELTGLMPSCISSVSYTHLTLPTKA